jgi:hypothetical protein
MAPLFTPCQTPVILLFASKEVPVQLNSICPGPNLSQPWFGRIRFNVLSIESVGSLPLCRRRIGRFCPEYGKRQLGIHGFARVDQQGSAKRSGSRPYSVTIIG